MKENPLTKEIAEHYIAGKIATLEDFTSIDSAAAKALATYNGVCLSLDGLTKLSEEAAKQVASFLGKELSLNGLTGLSDEVPTFLASFKGNTLRLNGLRELSEEAAKALVAFKGRSLSLEGLTNLSDEAARALAAFKGWSLSLEGLTSLSNEAAKALATFKGEGISLNGLTSLSDEVAKTVASCKAFEVFSHLSSMLVFDGVTSLSTETANALASFKGKGRRGLSLDGVTSLSDEAAKALVTFKGDRISLNGLTRLSDEAAKALATFKGKQGGDLSLGGLTCLSLEAAKALVTCKGKVLRGLSLEGLTVLSPEVAEVLASFKGDRLSLEGLAVLSPEAAKTLAAFKGEYLILDGLTSLSEEAAKALAAFKGVKISLKGLTSLSDDAVKSISSFEGGHIDLEGLTSLSEEVAKIAASCKAFAVTETFSDKPKLAFDSVKSLSAKAAKALASFQGEKISLDGLISISDEAATFLASFKGKFLSLDSLGELSEEAAKAIAAFKPGLHPNGNCVLALPGLTSLTDKAAKALASFKGDHIRLDGLQSISHETAKALASFKGNHIRLDGLKSICQDTAKALATFSGDWLELRGLTSLSAEAAKALATFKGKDFLILAGLTSLSAEVAKALATFKGGIIILDGLTSLSDEAVKSISSFEGGGFTLNGLRTLSDEAAKTLASINGGDYDAERFRYIPFSLQGLRRLSKVAVKALESSHLISIYPPDIEICGHAKEAVRREIPHTSPCKEETEQGQEQNNEAAASNQFIEALAGGNIAEAVRLRAGGARIYDDAETLNAIFASLWEKHSLSMFSRPVNPDILPRIVPLKDVIKACGPIYESGSACFSLSQRPSGWASAVKAQRVISWHDSGFGFLGDPAVDINLRLVTAKPLTAFGDAIIAGPLPEDGFPEMSDGFIQDKQTSRERRKLPTREEAHRLFYNLVVSHFDLDWTKDLIKHQCLRQPALELLAEEGQKLDGGFDARMEFSLFDDLGHRQKAIKNLSATDPAVAGLAVLLLLSMECVSAMEGMKTTSSILKRHAKAKPATEWEVALWEISLLCLQVADGNEVRVSDVEAFQPFLRNPAEPALSIQIERTCSALCTHIAAQSIEKQDPMNADFALRLCKCGWRPPIGFLIMTAVETEDTDLLSYLLSCGMYPMGHHGGAINLVPLAAAAMHGNSGAAKLLLKAGADVFEPTQYGGASTLQQLRWNCANLEVGEKEKACLKLLESAVKNDPRVAWLSPALND